MTDVMKFILSHPVDFLLQPFSLNFLFIIINFFHSFSLNSFSGPNISNLN